MSNITKFPFHLLIYNTTSEAILTVHNLIPFLFISPSMPTHELCYEVKKHVGLINEEIIFIRFECDMLFEHWYMPKLIIFHIISPETQLVEKLSWKKVVDINQTCLLPYNDIIFNFISNLQTVNINDNRSFLLPYSKLGWFHNVQSWISDIFNLRNDQYKLRQIQQSIYGCVIKVLLHNNNIYYFKSLPPAEENNEIINLKILHSVLPEYFESPFAINERSSWFVTRNYGNPIGFGNVTRKKNCVFFHEILESWGNIQIRSINQIDSMVEKGIKVLTCSSIKTRLERMTSDTTWYEAQVRGLKKDALPVHSLLEYKKRLEHFVDSLQANLNFYKIPLTLVHGDLNPANIIHTGKDFIYFDLNTTCISYPFYDALTFADVCGFSESDIDSYFNLWKTFEEFQNLKQYAKYVEQFQSLLYFLFLYEGFIKSEECGKANSLQELEHPISTIFPS